MHNPFMQKIQICCTLVSILFFPLQIVSANEIEPTNTFASKNFWELNKALGFYESAAKLPWAPIPDKPQLLKVGTKSNAVLILREDLKTTGDLDPANDQGGRRFDSQLETAVAAFQTRHGLKADGAVGDDTRAQLNVSPQTRAKQIAINLQRWASLAKKLDNRFILVNIPDFHMYLYENNQKLLSLRAIVGKPELQTPEITSHISRVVFNPYWNIPDKIAQKDIAPKMLADPGYMRRMHIRAFRQEDNDSSEISPYRINWHSAAANGLNYHLRQDPGPDNALGLVKFEFENSHSIYMHDTSAKNLFERDMRSYSHGCIRLENPFELVEYLMKDNPAWDNEHIRQILDTGETKYVKIKNPIPIFITYITSWVDDDGRINFRDDVYQLDGITPDTNEKLTAEANFEQNQGLREVQNEISNESLAKQNEPLPRVHHRHRHHRIHRPESQFYAY